MIRRFVLCALLWTSRQLAEADADDDDDEEEEEDLYEEYYEFEEYGDLPTWARWRTNDIANATASHFCSLYTDAWADLARRDLPGFAGWQGKSPTFKVPYEVRMAPGKGLGIFATKAIKKGTLVYLDDPETHIRVPKHSVQAGAEMAESCSAQVVDKALQWCFVDSSRAGDGLLCQVDDGRYMNSDEDATLEMCSKTRGMCAARNLRPGEELTEDYEGNLIDDAEGFWVVSAIMRGTGHRLHRPCPACQHGKVSDVFLTKLAKFNTDRWGEVGKAGLSPVGVDTGAGLRAC
eukprot:TRINITY_DN22573_c0_g1_i1.p1 TRINITY_DN22573_c0_g1~~TRINITY_DN22573_c0_g1_i1.p1  ORF type:complete len:291 (+),score=46.41 TRINITY_DN22573_c0_g1_i1:46-918(+)